MVAEFQTGLLLLSEMMPQVDEMKARMDDMFSPVRELEISRTTVSVML